MTKPLFFQTPADFRTWLEKHHATGVELVAGFHKKDTGRASITWPESVDCALCYGWIDGVRRSLDADSYSIRFTPRRPTSIWSAVNVGRANELIKLGLMRPAGLKAFEARNPEKTAIYAYEKETAKLSAGHERRFRATKKAWSYFQAQPPWYRRTSTHWIVSAKKEETRDKRLNLLIECCAAERAIPALQRPTK